MNPSPKELEEFRQLRSLLTLKRIEQPPPGYFDHFSDKVVARIEADALVMRVSWWQRLFPGFDAKPVLACAYGLVITGLLVVGLGVSQSLESDESAAPRLGNPWLAQAPPPALLPSPATVRPLTEQTDTVSSVNPVFTGTAPRFLFDVNQMKVEKASYNLR